MWIKRLVSAGPILFAVLVAVIIHASVVMDPLSRFEYLVMVVATDVDTIIGVYPQKWDTSRQIVYSDKPISGVILVSGGVRVVKIPLKNRVVSYLKLEFSAGRTIDIQQIKFLSHYASDKIVRGSELHTFLTPADQHTKVVLNQGGVTLRSEESGCAITTAPVKTDSFWLAYMLPVLIGGLAYLLANNYKLAVIPAFHDMIYRHVGERKFRIELDGLRGLAALLVVMEHTWGRFQGVGATGVWIFFALSGFLLVQPFISTPSRIIDKVYVTQYLVRRLARIVPMYYVTVLILFAMGGHVDKLIDHFLFLQADGHFWTVQQEIVFYLALPWIVLALYGVSKIRPLLAIAILSIITALSLYEPGLIPVRLFGYGRHLPFYLGLFTCGMLSAYLSSTEYVSRLNNTGNHLKRWISIAGFILISVLALMSINSFTTHLGLGMNLAKKHVMLFGLGCTLILLFVHLAQGTLLSKLFSIKLLRSIGVVGYSYYLLHPIVAWKLIEFSKYYIGRPVTGSRMFIATAIVTWMVSVCTYSLIEKPFMSAAKKHKVKQLKMTWK